MNLSESRTRQRWVERVERQRSSGLSVPAFCSRHGIGVCSLYAWRKRLAAAPAFVEATIVEASGARSAGVIEVRLRGGRRVLVRRENFDRALLLEVVAALESLPGESEGAS